MSVAMSVSRSGSGSGFGSASRSVSGAAAGSAPRPSRRADPGRSTDVDPATTFGITAALDSAPDGVVVADHAGTVRYVNAAAERIVDVDAAEASGRRLADVLPLFDGRGRSWWSCTDPFGGLAIRTRQPERLLWLPDGRQLLVTAAYVRTGGPRTAVTQVVVGVRPVAGRLRARRSDADLVAVAAHELRSPLTSIQGFSSTLLAKWDRFSEDQRRLMVETIVADAHRLARLIGDLLDVARIDAGQLALRPAWLDLASQVRRVIARLVGNGTRADRFTLAVGPAVPLLWADPDKLERALLNLVENAVRHGRGTVTISVDADPGDPPADNSVATRRSPRDRGRVDGVQADGVVVTVTDEGEGVPEHLAAHAFNKYWRGGHDGAGLGLYVVRGIVEAHGGSIEVERAETGGARFRFRLPVGQPEPPA